MNIIAKYILFGHNHHNSLKAHSFIYNITNLVSNLTLGSLIGSNISQCHYIYKSFWIWFIIGQLYTNFMAFKWPWVLQNKGKTILINLQKLLNLVSLGSNEYKSNIWFLFSSMTITLGALSLLVANASFALITWMVCFGINLFNFVIFNWKPSFALKKSSTPCYVQTMATSFWVAYSTSFSSHICHWYIHLVILVCLAPSFVLTIWMKKRISVAQ